MMSYVRVKSSPELLPDDLTHHHDPLFEGVSANVKLLLKLMQDHHDATKDDDGRNPQRVAGMITILDNVRSRIEKSQPPQKPRLLQRCNTDVRRTAAPPRDRKPLDPTEENQKLRKDLSASVAAQKSLEKMFSSLGKEKEIIASELARKVQELSDLEELVGDLRAQNETLTAKVKACAAEHKGNVGDAHGSAVLQERNKSLSEQLLKSLDGYRSMKRRLKEAHEENTKLKSVVAETAKGFAAGIDRIRGVCWSLCNGFDGKKEMAEGLVCIERMLVGFQEKFLSKGNPKGAE